MKKPVLALNGTIFNQKNSGAKQRFTGLFNAVINQEQNFNYSLFTDESETLKECFKNLDSISFIKSPLSADKPISRFLKGTLFWNKNLATLRPKILDHSHLPLIKNKYGATFLTIHDIRYIRNPEIYSFFRRKIAPSILKKSVLNSDAVITVSQSIKDEILNFIPHPNIVVIPNGLDAAAMPNPNGQDFEDLKKLGIKKPFLLSVGHFEKRKNFSALISAFSQMKNKNDYQLVIAGNPADDLENLLALILKLNLKDSVLLLKNMDFKLICSLYKNCELFIFPSLYEGFGIPILEAIFYESRIILSDIPVFREITRGKSIYFDPRNISDIQEKIENTLNNSSIDLEFKAETKSILENYSYKQSANRYIGLMNSFI